MVKLTEKSTNYTLIIAGIVFYILFILLVDLKPGSPKITYTAAIAILMALWWVTEAIPIGVTSLLPVILFPLMGIMDGKDISEAYINYVIFLFIGGFLMALSIEKWGLHKRIALKIISLIGVSPLRIIAGFMTAAAFLSMWMSNTATAMMMLPIAFSVSLELDALYSEEKVNRLNSGILLAIAYACSIGGITTLVGTPPNLSFVRIFDIIFPNGPDIIFSQWLLFAAPITIIMFAASLFVLYFMYKPKQEIEEIDKEFFNKQYEALGPVSTEQKRVFMLFILLVILWVFRKNIDFGFFSIPGWSQIFKTPGFLNDGTVAIFVATLLFMIPSTKKGQALIDWTTARKIPWNIVLLFGGGFALAKGFVDSGLSQFIGEQLSGAKNFGTISIIGTLTALMTGLTEFTSNTATTEMLLPVVSGLAVEIETNPLVLMIPITLAASMAFMFPIATPPNAIVFGSGKLKMSQMMKTGIFLNIIAIITITLVTYFWATVMFNIDLNNFPDWAIESALKK